MASFTSELFVVVYTCVSIFVLTSQESQQIKVKPGEDVTLQCQDPSAAAITLLEWKRPDRDINVFVWRNRKLSEDDQHPSFHGRVELRDPEMKDRNFSVILKNVSINDTGTYECRVRKENTTTPPQSICNINLDVQPVELKDPEMKDGNFSVILKKVTINDTGTYKCRVRNNNTTLPQLINSITMNVTDSGQDEHQGDEDGHLGLRLILSAVGVILAAVIVFMILRKCKWHIKKNPYFPPADEAADEYRYC